MNELYRDSMAAAVDRLYDEVGRRHRRRRGQREEDLLRRRQPQDDDAGDPDDAPAVFADRRGDQGRPAPARDASRGRSWPRSTAPRSAAASRSRWPATTGSLVDDPRLEVGLPEATLGLLPGGGGVTRIVRMLGIQTALMDVLLQGTRFKPADALEKGLVDEVVATRDELLPAAKAWIMANPRRAGARTRGTARATRCPAARRSPRRWRRSCRRSRRCCASRPRARSTPPSGRSCRPRSRAPRSTSTPRSRIESRYLTKLIVGQNSKNMIQAFFFDLQAINAGKLRPRASRRSGPPRSACSAPG